MCRKSLNICKDPCRSAGPQGKKALQILKESSTWVPLRVQCKEVVKIFNKNYVSKQSKVLKMSQLLIQNNPFHETSHYFVLQKTNNYLLNQFLIPTV